MPRANHEGLTLHFESVLAMITRGIRISPQTYGQCLLIVWLCCNMAAASDWPRFRGPNGSGVSDATQLPIHFGPTRNVIWKTSLPQGHSSPVVVGDSIYLTAYSDKSLFAICLSRATGEILWRRELPRKQTERYHEQNTPASPTPVADANNVYVFFPEFGLVAFRRDGQERWRFPLGPFNNHHGMASSPILVEDKVVLQCDQDTNAFLLAVDKSNGKLVWKTKRSEVIQGFSTPVLYYPHAGSPQIITSGSFHLIAYGADKGEKLWWISGLAWQPKTTPLVGDDLIFIHSTTSGTGDPKKHTTLSTFTAVLQERDRNKDGRLSLEEADGPGLRDSWIVVDLDKDGTLDAYEWDNYRAMLNEQNGVFAVRPGDRGDVTKTNVQWSYWRSLPNVSSPLLYRNVIYLVKDGGVLTSLDSCTGRVLKQARLAGATEQYFASPVAGAEKVFLVGESGKVTVLSAVPEWQVLALNDLEDDCFATPAIAGGRMYFRTRHALYCFGEASAKSPKLEQPKGRKVG
jgi:outer membrane protein assembly factor BamB